MIQKAKMPFPERRAPLAPTEQDAASAKCQLRGGRSHRVHWAGRPRRGADSCQSAPQAQGALCQAAPWSISLLLAGLSSLRCHPPGNPRQRLGGERAFPSSWPLLPAERSSLLRAGGAWGRLAELPAPLSWPGRGSRFLPRINKELQRLRNGVIQQNRPRGEAKPPSQHS